LDEPKTPEHIQATDAQLAFKTPISKLLLSIEEGFAQFTPPTPLSELGGGFTRPGGLFTPFPLHTRKSAAISGEEERMALDDIVNIRQ
jgi:hypothetical protein